MPVNCILSYINPRVEADGNWASSSGEARGGRQTIFYESGGDAWYWMM